MAANNNVRSIAQSMSQPNQVADPTPDIDISQFLDEPEAPAPTMGQQIQQVQDNVDERSYQVRDNVLDVDQFLDAPNEVSTAAPASDVAPIDESFLGANFNLTEQLEVLPARVRASFGRTSKEKFSLLEKHLGAGNVRKDGEDNFLVRLPGKDKFRKLDPETFDVLGDLFADNFRDTISGMMGAGAVAAQGPAAIEPVSSAAAFGLGVAAGEVTADWIAESVLGANRDPSRGGTVDQKGGVLERVEAGTERTIEALTTGATAAVLNKGIEKVSSALSNRLAARAARKAAIKQAREIPEWQKLKDSVQDNLDTVAELKSLNILQNIPGTDTPLMAHQMLPDTKAPVQLAKGLQGSDAFHALQDKASKQLGDTLMDMVDTAADLSGGTMKQTIRSGVKTAKSGLADDVGSLIEKSIRAEGKLIGEFRKNVSAEMAGQPLALNKTAQNVQEFLDEVGLEIIADNNRLAQFLGTDNKAILKGFEKDIRELVRGAQSGVNIDQLLGKIKLMGNMQPAAKNIGGQYKRWMGKFISGLRDDAREGMVELLDEADGATYLGAMQKFKSFSETRTQLQGLLQDEMGANTFARLLLTKGKAGLGNLKAAKQFLQDTDPKLWDGIRTEFFEELALKYRNPGGASGIEYNIKGMRKELAGYGKEFLDEMFPSQGKIGGAGLLFKTFDLAEQVQRASIKGTDDEVERALKELAKATSQFVSAKINSAMALFGISQENKRIAKLISKEGIDKFLDKVPPSKLTVMRQALGDALGYMKDQGQLTTLRMGQTAAPVVLSQDIQKALQGLSGVRGAPRSELPR